MRAGVNGGAYRRLVLAAAVVTMIALSGCDGEAVDSVVSQPTADYRITVAACSPAEALLEPQALPDELEVESGVGGNNHWSRGWRRFADARVRVGRHSGATSWH